MSVLETRWHALYWMTAAGVGWCECPPDIQHPIRTRDPDPGRKNVTKKPKRTHRRPGLPQKHREVVAGIAMTEPLPANVPVSAPAVLLDVAQILRPFSALATASETHSE
jgi:hypothetical protein